MKKIMLVFAMFSAIRFLSSEDARRFETKPLLVLKDAKNNPEFNLERIDEFVGKVLDESSYRVNYFDSKARDWKLVAQDQSLWYFYRHKNTRIPREIADKLGEPLRQKIYLASLDDMYKNKSKEQLRDVLNKQKTKGPISEEAEWQLGNYF